MNFNCFQQRAVLLAILALAGCSGEEYVRPDPPISHSWPGGPGLAAATREAARIDWREFFPDPKLQAYIETALQQNRDLRIALGRMQQARAEYGISQANRLPAINGTFSGTVNSQAKEFAGFGDPVVDRRYDLMAGVVSFELDFWNRLGSLSAAARESYLATESARRALRLSLISDVATTYFSMLDLEERAKMAKATIELRAKTLALVELAQNTGFASPLERISAATATATARSELAQLERQLAAAKNKLTLLSGGEPTNIPPGRPLLQQDVVNNLAPGLPAEVLLARPDVVDAEQRLKAANANIGAARAAFLPKILLTASTGLASRALSTLFGSGQSAWGFEPVMNFPLFDWGRAQSSLDIAEARKNIAVAEYEKTIQESFREVADLLAARAALRDQQVATAEQMAMSYDRLKIIEAQQREGFASMLNIFDAQRELLVTKQAELLVKRQQLENSAQLYKALGGGELLAPTTLAALN